MECSQRAGEMASERIGLGVKPDIRCSDNVHGPVIWCWGRHPVILLSETNEAAPDRVDWTGVFCHELAHWVRRDHWSSLLGEILVAIVPWNPLAWACRWRLAQLGEFACDDWAIACGQEPADYAETLVRLLPAPRTASTLAAISRRSGLSARISHIIAIEGIVDPWPGRVWSGSISLVAVSLAATLALAQTPAMTKAKQRDSSRSAAATRNAPDNDQRSIRRTLWGEVRDTAGKPVSGAAIFAVGTAEPKSEMVDGQLEQVGEVQKILGQTISAKAGGFQLELRVGPEIQGVDLVAKGPDGALSAANFSLRPDNEGVMPFPLLPDESITLNLPKNIPIEGQLLSPTGQPVTGARVELLNLGSGNDINKSRQWYLGGPERSHDGRPERLPYWPEATVSNSEGRFHLDGYPEGTLAEIAVKHDAYIHEALIISTAGALRPWYNEWNLKPVAPRFTHVLEISRPIEGTVTDKETGKPVEGVDLEMSVSRPMDWLFRFKTSTDAKGHYRLQGVGWNRPNLYANVSPRAQSGYLPFQDQHDERWIAGAEKLVWNFSVKRGQVVRGTVIDAETRKPIPGARVAGAGEMLTDQTGSFAMAMPPGQRLLFVEGPTLDYQRVTIPRGQSDSSATLFPHAYARIDVPRDRGAEPVEIALKRGATIAAQAVDSQDKPVSDVVVSGLSLFARLDRSGQTARHYASGLFRMASFVPGKPYRVFFIQNERHLAGFADITPRGEAGQPVPVALRPMASVRGTLLKPDGAPVVGKRVMAHLQTTVPRRGA